MQINHVVLDMSLMKKTPPVPAAVQDILTHLPRLMGWLSMPSQGQEHEIIEITSYHIRNCRVHLEESQGSPKVFLYNLSIWVNDKRKADPSKPNCPDVGNNGSKSTAKLNGYDRTGMVEEIWVDVLWRGPEDVRLIYAVKETDAYHLPEPANFM